MSLFRLSYVHSVVAEANITSLTLDNIKIYGSELCSFFGIFSLFLVFCFDLVPFQTSKGNERVMVKHYLRCVD